MLNNIIKTPLKKIQLDGGDVLHGMKKNDEGYAGFGEAYFSSINPGAIKAWKRHIKMTLNLVVPIGKVKFVFYDVNSDSFKEEVIGINNYIRITVPPGIWFGFQGMGLDTSFVMNIANIVHNASEVERLSLSDIDYKWS